MWAGSCSYRGLYTITQGNKETQNRSIEKMARRSEGGLEQMKEEKLDDLEHLGRNPVVTTLWIGFAVSLLGILGITILSVFLGQGIQDMYFRISLGVFVIGVLIISFAFILRRIRKKGLDYFVAGAITAYIGFLLLALPVILIAIISELPGSDYLYFITMGVGVLLVIFGFLMEAYELNKKLMEFLRRIKITFVKLIKRIKWKLIFSPWNLLTLVGITVIVLTILNIMPFLDNLYYYIIGGSLIGINIIIHLRREIYEIFKDITRVI
jgi:MFS family permease